MLFSYTFPTTWACSGLSPARARPWRANETADHRSEVLKNIATYQLYFEEYQSMSGTQTFLNAYQNYPDLIGQQTNLFKCFLPQAWMYGNSSGFSAYVHPNGVFDDPKGKTLRKKLYPHLRKHFRFENELKLFKEVGNAMKFSLNIYSNRQSRFFEAIFNLFSPSTIDECYCDTCANKLMGIKDDQDNWNLKGHPGRVLTIGKEELSLFASLFDEDADWETAKIPLLHAQTLTDVLKCFAIQETTIGSLASNVYPYQMWNEAGAQADGTICRNVHFPETSIDWIFSGPHIGVANPLFQTSQRNCNTHRAFDSIDLTSITTEYRQRCNYSPNCNMQEYFKRIPKTPWGTSYKDEYRIYSRKMLNQSGERTLIPAIGAPDTTYIDGVFGFAINGKIAHLSGTMASIPYDFYFKATGKTNGRFELISQLPLLKEDFRITARALLLNCVNVCYADLFKREYSEKFREDNWSKCDSRLSSEKFAQLGPIWENSTPLRFDYERRQALVEIDVLTAMSLKMSLDQLITIYRIQFPVLQQYEADTWYDANGRIVFTNNRSLVGGGFDRKEFELNMKDAPAGKKFYRTIMDDTMPGGPVERTIEYVAPFDRCDREQDYETAWKFFEEKYGDTQ